MTAEKFLNRLPKCVIRQGEVIDIRGPMRDSLQVRPALISPGDFITNPGPACSVLSRGTGEGEDREESLELCYNFWVTVELVSALCWAPEGCQVDCKWGKVKVQVGARGEPQGPGMSLRHSPGCPFLIVLQAPHLTPILLPFLGLQLTNVPNFSSLGLLCLLHLHITKLLSPVQSGHS
jgi:hypothetical protein